MSYARVIPRDLFNEASLLKCYGKIFIELEKMGKQDSIQYLTDSGEGFDVQMYEDDGSLYIFNVIVFDKHGEVMSLYRPLNSRKEWPLLAMTPEGEEILVFKDDGTFSDEFKNLI